MMSPSLRLRRRRAVHRRRAGCKEEQTVPICSFPFPVKPRRFRSFPCETPKSPITALHRPGEGARCLHHTLQRAYFDLSDLHLGGGETGEILVILNGNSYHGTEHLIIKEFTPNHTHTRLLFQQVLVNHGVSKVVASEHPDFKVSDLVWGITGWEEYILIPNPESLFKINHHEMPLSYYIGVLGMPGLTVYTGFFYVSKPKKGDYVFVSAASGEHFKFEAVPFVHSCSSDWHGAPCPICTCC